MNMSSTVFNKQGYIFLDNFMFHRDVSYENVFFVKDTKQVSSLLRITGCRPEFYYT